MAVCDILSLPVPIDLSWLGRIGGPRDRGSGVGVKFIGLMIVLAVRVVRSTVEGVEDSLNPRPFLSPSYIGSELLSCVNWLASTS